MPEKSAERIYDRPTTLGGDVVWAHPPRKTFHGNAEALRRDLAARVDGEVRFDSGSKATYATDASNYRQVPIGVVLPKSTDALAAAVAVCRKHGAPITHRGGGASLAGQCCNHAVIIDSSKYCDGILEINPDEKWARVEPGVRRDQLTNRTEAEHRLTFGPDTSTHEYATFGGMIGNNSCGMHSQIAGRTQDNVHELEILLYDGTRMRVGPASEDELEAIIREGGRKGEIYKGLRALRDEYADLIRARYPDIPRRVSGFNLEELLPENGFHVARALVGTEGTCVTILEAKVRLIDSPPARAHLVLGFEDIYAAGDRVVEVGETGALALEGLDDELLDEIRHRDYELSLLPDDRGFLIAEYGGDTPEAAREAAQRARLEIEDYGWNELESIELVSDLNKQRKIWAIREAGLGVTAHRPDGVDTWEGWEDSAVPPAVLGDYLRDLRALYHKYDYRAALYGHFGQACVHTRIPFDLESEAGIEEFRAFIDEASDLCLAYGGSFSAEHGDGQARGELLPKMYGRELMQAFRAFKGLWDPDGKMNPGKVVDPVRMDDHLRLGADYHPQDPPTHFKFPEDGGSFARAALRCVGVGKCRRHDEDPERVMCPSFLATHEEEHTTRGRARLLFEMLRGDDVTPNAWDNDDVKDALDLCLSCKGCKSDCPVNVDMATYKAEFLSHYYEANRRPRHAYAFGLIHWWARLASKAPALTNFFSQTPGLSAVAKAVAGAAPQRELPRFAPETFRTWFNRRSRSQKNQEPKAKGQEPVVLFPDTFTNHLTPDVGKAATRVLEAAGYRVVLPQETLCCGRPLYDYGWIEPAKRLWREMLRALRPYYRAGIPIVGLEPSCVAAFRDELHGLFPDDEGAALLSQNVFTLGEFLDGEAEGYEPPRLPRKALAHGHCHHKSIMGMGGEYEVLKAMELEFDNFVPSSCCGMAGAFGFEKEHYDVSIKAGEFALLPAVREASAETLIIADGFSCREQIRQTTGRRALHLAEVIHLAPHTDGRTEAYPEQTAHRALREAMPHDGRTSGAPWLAAAGAFAGGAALSYLAARSADRSLFSD